MATKYYHEHREEACEKGKIFRLAHPEREREKKRKYFLANPDKMRAMSNKRVLKWERMHPETHAVIESQRRAKIAGAKGHGLTPGQWSQICEETSGRCVYCGQRKKLTIDHVVPISKGGIHDVSNIVPACLSCNVKKNDSSLLMFLHRRSNFG
jgi:5-methylcytosine-specific restriction endonuclease McrA